MKPIRLNLKQQWKVATDTVLLCDQYAQTLHQLDSQIAEQQSEHQVQLKRVIAAAELERDQQRDSAMTVAAQQRSEINGETDQHLSLVSTQHQRTVHNLTTQTQQQLTELEERRQQEDWILNSVLDETSEDSPVVECERLSEAFILQHESFQESKQVTGDYLKQANKYLSECHSRVSMDLPAAVYQRGRVEEVREIATAEYGNVMLQLNRVYEYKLPSVVRGLRIWGLSLLAFLLLWILTISVREDVTKYLNPELHRPDTQWLVVAGCLSAVIVGFTALMVLLVTQNRLRGRFTEALQSFSNAKAATAEWESRSTKRIAKLEAVAEQYDADLQQQREQKLAKLTETIDGQISSVRQRAAEMTSGMTQQLNASVAAAQQNLLASLASINQHQEQQTNEIQQRFEQELHRQLSTIRAAHIESIQVLQAQRESVASEWDRQVRDFQKFASDAKQLVHRNRQLPAADKQWQLPSTVPGFTGIADVLVTTTALDELGGRLSPCEKLTAEDQPVESPFASEPSDQPPVNGAQVDGSHVDGAQSDGYRASDVQVIEAFAPSSTTRNVCVEMPAVLPFPSQMSICIQHDAAGRDTAVSFLRRQVLTAISNLPAGRFRLTLIDPVGLGQSFSALMHLSDFDEMLIYSRIWTESRQIREQLQKVTEHMENVFQTYLRSEFDSIEEYNESAGEVAEPYHFVVVAGFPNAFTEESAMALSSILTSGPRCGVHAMVAWNPAMDTPSVFDSDELIHHCTNFTVKNNTIQYLGSESGEPIVDDQRLMFEADQEPKTDEYVKLVRRIGDLSKNARRVEVSFSRVAPKLELIWTHSTADGIDLPIGRAGAARLQYMRLGRGTSQHVLVAGKTGSGKSTFLHIVITNLALHYSPTELQFYLIDFKKGVEFQTYAANRLPHARVVAIESDREFGLSVLERLDQVLQERGELFRERGVQDVPSFRSQFPNEPMPRLLLLIDEFQEFFVSEDRVSSRASLLLDRLVRQGRAFGVHVLLGSQTLGGAYSLARSTMGQIAVRIALQCSETDAHLILSEDNSAARLLARPGEAIYNDANGLVQGNNTFQIAWLEDDRRQQAIDTMKQQQPVSTEASHPMIVFEGNIPPVAEACGPLNAWLRASSDATTRSFDGLDIWLGEPLAIAAPTQVQLKRAGGQNVVIVGQDEKMVSSLIAFTMLSCAFRPSSDRGADIGSRMMMLLDRTDTEFADQLMTLGQRCQSNRLTIGTPSDVSSTMEELISEVTRREECSDVAQQPTWVLTVCNLGQFRELRKAEDDFGMGGFGEAKAATPASLFADVIKRGPSVGIHVVLWSDTFSNALRWLSNSLLREFETRIAFRMNQTDSSNLVDSPVAVGLENGRAVIYRDRTGTTEKFRPFAWPTTDWLDEIQTDVPSILVENSASDAADQDSACAADTDQSDSKPVQQGPLDGAVQDADGSERDSGDNDAAGPDIDAMMVE
ncbi:MAG: FtsK/SpoIIIE domain-containing protein [Fuerstiella sp.]